MVSNTWEFNKQVLSDQVDPLVIDHPSDDSDQDLPVDDITCPSQDLQILSHLFRIRDRIPQDTWSAQRLDHGNKKNPELSSMGWTRS